MTAKFCVKCGHGSFVPGVPLCYDCADQDIVTGAAAALHKQAIAILRGYDRAQVIKDLAGDQDAAQAALADAQQQVPALEAEIKAAVQAERQAQDVAKDFARNAAKREAERKRAQRNDAPADQQDEALAKERAAADLAQGKRAAYEGAVAKRKDAQAALAAHLGQLEALEIAAEATRKNAEDPPALVPMSAHTLFAGHPLFLLAQPDLTEDERVIARLGIKVAADSSGLTDQLHAEGRSQGRQEADEEARSRPRVLSSPDGTRTGLISAPLPGRFSPGRH